MNVPDELLELGLTLMYLFADGVLFVRIVTTLPSLFDTSGRYKSQYPFARPMMDAKITDSVANTLCDWFAVLVTRLTIRNTTSLIDMTPALSHRIGRVFVGSFPGRVYKID